MSGDGNELNDYGAPSVNSRFRFLNSSISEVSEKQSLVKAKGNEILTEKALRRLESPSYAVQIMESMLASAIGLWLSEVHEKRNNVVNKIENDYIHKDSSQLLRDWTDVEPADLSWSKFLLGVSQWEKNEILGRGPAGSSQRHRSTPYAPKSGHAHRNKGGKSSPSSTPSSSSSSFRSPISPSSKVALAQVNVRMAIIVSSLMTVVQLGQPAAKLALDSKGKPTLSSTESTDDHLHDATPTAAAATTIGRPQPDVSRELNLVGSAFVTKYDIPLLPIKEIEFKGIGGERLSLDQATHLEVRLGNGYVPVTCGVISELPQGVSVLLNHATSAALKDLSETRDWDICAIDLG
ncbi:hypothetical protein FOL47_004953 [Perkinsus chesapeaki]|uniref:Uncharacterized protein n=1 Tax=Perkinsus chesapeaki TaxID=330153 RepID=A0A7J6MYS0_PERCH|nr:hypothetical protein FOL47_004953 [Perkinsus chesapeaki]